KVAALIVVDRGRGHDRRLAPRLPALRGVHRALRHHVVEVRLLAQPPRRETRQQRVLPVLRRRVREHGEAADGLERFLGAMLLAERAHRRGNRRGVTLDQDFVKRIQCFLVFFAGAGGAFFAGGAAAVPPSPSERLSSTSTVCVIAVSVALWSGLAAAGAMVCV